MGPGLATPLVVCINLMHTIKLLLSLSCLPIMVQGVKEAHISARLDGSSRHIIYHTFGSFGWTWGPNSLVLAGKTGWE